MVLTTNFTQEMTIERQRTYGDVIEIKRNELRYSMSTSLMSKMLASDGISVDVYCDGKGKVGTAIYSIQNQNVIFEVDLEQFDVKAQLIYNAINFIRPEKKTKNDLLSKSPIKPSAAGYVFIDLNPGKYIGEVPIFNLGTYYPIAIVPQNETFSNDILTLKNDYYSDLQQEIIHKFTKEIIALLHKNHEFVVCLIPNSSLGFNSSGLFHVAKNISIPPIIDGTRVIKRIHKLQPKHLGGSRDYYKEKESMQVSNPDMIKNRIVLLLDDVTTTGTSLWAGRRLLLNAGAEDVVLFALGKTYHIDNSGEEYGRKVTQ